MLNTNKSLLLLFFCLTSLVIPLSSSVWSTAEPITAVTPLSEPLMVPAPLTHSTKYLRPAEHLSPGDKQPEGVKSVPLNKQKTPAIGTRKSLVLLVGFSDVKGTTSISYYNDLVFSNNPGSVNHYYTTSSRGQLTVTGEVGGQKWYNASQTLAWYGADATYGNDDLNGEIYELVEEVVQLADADVDFSQFDTNSDGYVDSLAVVHAGAGQESSGVSTDIWSHRWAVPNGVLVDGVRVYTYTMQAESSPMGTFAHEFGHDFGGLPDLYDTGSESDGIGKWGMMAEGAWNGPGGDGSRSAHFSAWSQIQLGWITPTIIDTSGTYTLHSFNDTGEVYKIVINESPYEYFLLSYRQKEGYYDSYLPGSGLLIWHIDESRSDNDDENHKLVDLEEADGEENLDVYLDGDAGSSTDPFNGTGAEFSFDTTPNSDAYTGEQSGIKISQVVNATGGQDSAAISFVVDLDVWTYTGESSAQAIPLRDGQTKDFQLDSSEDHWFYYGPTDPRQGLDVSFELQFSGVSPSDVALEILSPNDVTVVSSLSPSASPFTFNYTFLTGNKYFVKITNTGVANNVDFSLTMESLKGETMMHPDTFSRGISGANYTETLAAADDLYFYAFDARPGLIIYFTITANAMTDFDLYLLDSIGTELLPEDFPPDSYPEELGALILSSGTYFLKIHAYDGSGQFTLNVDVRVGETPDKAVIITQSTTFDDVLDATGDSFYYSINNTQNYAQTVTVSLTGDAGTDFDLYLYDHTLTTPLSQSTTHSYPETLTYALAAGELYYIEVYSYSGSGEFNLTISGLTTVEPSTTPTITIPTPGFTMGIVLLAICLFLVISFRKRKII
ncbi:MAG: M6 family metalloprotease domain-containing protein [Candidatus Hermodarchaeota archaeon]